MFVQSVENIVKLWRWIMSDLKTLKELEFGRTEKEDRKMLRAEAVKWIKHFEEKGKKKYKIFIPMNLWRAFFNISKEDLK